MDIKKSTKIVVKPKNTEVKDNNKSEPKDTSIQDLKPILIVCQLFGMPPSSISRKNAPLSKLGLIYSCLIIIYNFCVMYKQVEIMYYRNLGKKVKVLAIVAFILFFLIICADIIFSIFRHLELQDLLKNTFRRKKFKKTERSYFLPISIFLIITTAIFFLFMAVLPFLFKQNRILNSLIFITINQAFAFSVLKFSSIVIFFRRKFQHLNSTLLEEINSKSEFESDEICNLEDLCHSHEELSTAIEDLNCLYSMQLLLWIILLTFSIIARIYVFFTFKEITIFAVMREILLLVQYVILLVSLATVCHITAEEVNKMSSIIFSPSFFRRRQQTLNEDNVNIFQYFLNQSFSFKAGYGLFVVNAQLLFYIGGATITYLVMLLGPATFSNK